MNLNSAHLDAFFICAQLKNFTKAASRLHITQSALSQRIKNLEDELQTTLLLRERSGLRLTASGEELLRYCQIRSHLETELTSRIHGQNNRKHFQDLAGMVRIGAFSSVLRSVIIPALAPLLRSHPGIQLKVVSKELYELPELLKSGALDFIITDGSSGLTGLVSHPLGTENNVLVQQKNYSGPEVYLDHNEEDQTTFRYFKKPPSKPLKRRYLGDIYGILDGVRMGIGKAIVPYHLIAQLPDCEIIHPKRALSVPVVLQYFKQPYYSKLHHTLIETLKQNCPALLSGKLGQDPDKICQVSSSWCN